MCKYDRETGDYLNDGEPCRRDHYGDATYHCTARRTCSVHIGADELTCPRCIGRTRADIAWVRDLSALMPVEALGAGVESEALNLAGPAADPEAWSWRKVAARQGRAWHVSLIEDDDEQHPYTVLGRWALMLAEDYGHDLPTLTVHLAAGYLDRTLARVAHDDGQDFPLLAREIRACRSHLEAVLHNSRRAEVGVPCPTCKEAGHFVKLTRKYGHWCEDPDCTQQFHYTDDSGDEWTCPRNQEHRWTHRAYTDYLEERSA